MRVNTHTEFVATRASTSADDLRQTPLFELLRVQGRVVVALMLREIYTRFGRDNIGFAWIIAEPAIFCLSVILLWSFIKHSGHAETPIVPFLLTGYMPLLMYRHMVSRTMRCMQANAALLYHRQITVMTLYISRIAVEILGTSAAFMFCMLAFFLSGHIEVPDDPPLMLAGWLLYAWYAAATAILVGALSERSEVTEKIWGPISYVMIPLSGTFYMVDWMPAQVREAILWMPPVNGVEMIRGGYFSASVTAHFDAIYLVYVNLVLTACGLYVAKDARDHVEIE
jgi:capsular polysaccharide transport system permease protein